MNMKLRNIPFSPPDMSDAEIEMVAEALRRRLRSLNS